MSGQELVMSDRDQRMLVDGHCCVMCGLERFSCSCTFVTVSNDSVKHAYIGAKETPKQPKTFASQFEAKQFVREWPGHKLTFSGGGNAANGRCTCGARITILCKGKAHVIRIGSHHSKLCTPDGQGDQKPVESDKNRASSKRPAKAKQGEKKKLLITAYSDVQWTDDSAANMRAFLADKGCIGASELALGNLAVFCLRDAHRPDSMADSLRMEIGRVLAIHPVRLLVVGSYGPQTGFSVWTTHATEILLKPQGVTEYGLNFVTGRVRHETAIEAQKLLSNCGILLEHLDEAALSLRCPQSDGTEQPATALRIVAFWLGPLLPLLARGRAVACGSGGAGQPASALQEWWESVMVDTSGWGAVREWDGVAVLDLNEQSAPRADKGMLPHGQQPEGGSLLVGIELLADELSAVLANVMSASIEEPATDALLFLATHAAMTAPSPTAAVTVLATPVSNSNAVCNVAATPKHADLAEARGTGYGAKRGRVADEHAPALPQMLPPLTQAMDGFLPHAQRMALEGINAVQVPGGKEDSRSMADGGSSGGEWIVDKRIRSGEGGARRNCAKTHCGRAAEVGGLCLDCFLVSTTVEREGAQGRIGDFVIGELAKCLDLGRVPNLQKLRLEDSGIGPLGATALAGCLKSVPKLEVLFLSSNHIGDYGATTLAKNLGSVPNLSDLILSKNKIGDAGVASPGLAKWLGSVPKLQKLDLSGNPIGKEGLNALATALWSLSNLQELKLDLSPREVDWQAVADAVPTHWRTPRIAVPKSLQDTNWGRVLQWMRARAPVEWREASVVIVGNGSVGKTSLLHAMGGPDAEKNGNREPGAGFGMGGGGGTDAVLPAVVGVEEEAVKGEGTGEKSWKCSFGWRKKRGPDGSLNRGQACGGALQEDPKRGRGSIRVCKCVKCSAIAIVCEQCGGKVVRSGKYAPSKLNNEMEQHMRVHARKEQTTGAAALPGTPLSPKDSLTLVTAWTLRGAGASTGTWAVPGQSPLKVSVVDPAGGGFAYPAHALLLSAGTIVVLLFRVRGSGVEEASVLGAEEVFREQVERWLLLLRAHAPAARCILAAADSLSHAAAEDVAEQVGRRAVQYLRKLSEGAPEPRRPPMSGKGPEHRMVDVVEGRVVHLDVGSGAGVAELKEQMLKATSEALKTGPGGAYEKIPGGFEWLRGLLEKKRQSGSAWRVLSVAQVQAEVARYVAEGESRLEADAVEEALAFFAAAGAMVLHQGFVVPHPAYLLELLEPLLFELPASADEDGWRAEEPGLLEEGAEAAAAIVERAEDSGWELGPAELARLARELVQERRLGAELLPHLRKWSALDAEQRYAAAALLEARSLLVRAAGEEEEADDRKAETWLVMCRVPEAKHSKAKPPKLEPPTAEVCYSFRDPLPFGAFARVQARLLLDPSTALPAAPAWDAQQLVRAPLRGPGQAAGAGGRLELWYDGREHPLWGGRGEYQLVVRSASAAVLRVGCALVRAARRDQPASVRLTFALAGGGRGNEGAEWHEWTAEAEALEKALAHKHFELVLDKVAQVGGAVVPGVRLHDALRPACAVLISYSPEADGAGSSLVEQLEQHVEAESRAMVWHPRLSAQWRKGAWGHGRGGVDAGEGPGGAVVMLSREYLARWETLEELVWIEREHRAGRLRVLLLCASGEEDVGRAAVGKWSYDPPQEDLVRAGLRVCPGTMEFVGQWLGRVALCDVAQRRGVDAALREAVADALFKGSAEIEGYSPESAQEYAVSRGRGRCEVVLKAREMGEMEAKTEGGARGRDTRPGSDEERPGLEIDAWRATGDESSRLIREASGEDFRSLHSALTAEEAGMNSELASLLAENKIAGLAAGLAAQGYTTLEDVIELAEEEEFIDKVVAQLRPNTRDEMKLKKMLNALRALLNLVDADLVAMLVQNGMSGLASALASEGVKTAEDARELAQQEERLDDAVARLKINGRDEMKLRKMLNVPLKDRNDTPPIVAAPSASDAPDSADAASLPVKTTPSPPPPKMQRAPKRNGAHELFGRTASDLLSLPANLLLARIWPAERVVVGLRACKLLRQELPGFARSILLVKRWEADVRDDTSAAPFSPDTKVVLKWKGQELPTGLKRLAGPYKLRTALTHLDLSHNVYSAGGGNLDLRGNMLGAEEAAMLASVLKECKALAHLDLSGNEIGAEGAEWLAEVLAECKALAHLNLRWNWLAVKGTERLSGVLGGCKALAHLDLRENGLGPEAAGSLAGVLAECKALAHLNLHGNLLDAEAAESLAAVLGGCKALAHLDLSNNRVGASGVGSLARVLGGCKALAQLDLSHNDIGEEGAGRLAGVLGECTALAYLNLSHNEIGAEGAGRLAGVLGECRALVHLNLSDNRVGVEGARRLAGVLGECKALAHLDLSHNEIGAEGAERLAGVVWECQTLAHLDLSGHDIGAEVSGRLANSLGRCKIMFCRHHGEWPDQE